MSFPQKEITVILSSYILSEVDQIADYIDIIANGKLWYKDSIHKNEYLENLFMEGVRKSGDYHD